VYSNFVVNELTIEQNTLIIFPVMPLRYIQNAKRLLF